MGNKTAKTELKNSSLIQGERSSIFDLARGRLSILGTVFIVLYLIVAGRVLDLSVVQGSLMQIGAESEEIVRADTKAVRGNIYDQNGVLLATTLQTKSLFTDARNVQNPHLVLAQLNKIIPDLPQDQTLKKLGSGRPHLPLARDLTPEQQRAVLMLGEPGLGLEESARRIYPQGNLVAHLVGYADMDGKGLAGLERSFDNLLSNSRHCERPTEERQSGGDDWIASSAMPPHNDGCLNSDLVTTLDIRLQHALIKELAATMEEFQAKAATGLIMNVKTGAVLAGGSLPVFDANAAGIATDDERFNRLTLGVYELGSIFKIFSTAALLNEGAEMSQQFDARQPLKVGRFQIRDYHAEKRVMNVPEVFMHSSNIGSALMGDELGADKLKSYYRNLGLLEQAAFSTKEIGKPLVPASWRRINTLTASYGHGIAVSPLQMAAAVATTVGDGTFVQPSLVISPSEPAYKKRVFHEETAYKMRQLLRLNGIEGTGKKALVDGYMIGGKTGTADKPSATGGYEDNKKISSFVSVFPMDDPQYLVLVVVDDPIGHKGTYGYATGGWVGAPAAARITKHMIRILGLKPYEHDDETEFAAPLFPYIEGADKLAQR